MYIRSFGFHVEMNQGKDQKRKDIRGVCICLGFQVCKHSHSNSEVAGSSGADGHINVFS